MALVLAREMYWRLASPVAFPTPQLSVEETLMLPAGATAGYLSLVSSDSDGNTSELSAPIQVGEPGAVFKDGFETVVN